MDGIEAANQFGQLAASETAKARAYIGLTIHEDGETWFLHSANYAGVLYWQKRTKGKRLFVIGGYTVKDLAKLFPAICKICGHPERHHRAAIDESPAYCTYGHNCTFHEFAQNLGTEPRK